MEKQTNKRIELRSDEVQEVLSRPPHSLIRYGISVICFITLLLVLGSFLFKYPDIIEGKVVITTENPPVWIVAKSTGHITEIYFSDKDYVKKGDMIAVIENPSKADHVKIVKTLLIENSSINDTMIYVSPFLIKETYELGELQVTFSSFIKAVNNYQNFVALNLIEQDEILIKKEISGREVYLKTLKSQIDFKKKEVALAGISYEREKSLFEKGVISRSEMETTEQEYLNLQQILQQLESSIVSVHIENVKLRGTASRLTIEYLQDKSNKLSELSMTYQELMSEIERWEQTYLLTAPQSGNVVFNTFWVKNQDVKIGDKVFSVISQNPGNVLGKLKMPISGAGKVKVGQLVNIKVTGYPYLEYGVLKGVVKNISLVANDDYYTVEIEFPSKLQSTTGVDFVFNGKLDGVAEVITEDRSIASRILSPLKYLLKEKMINLNY